MFTGNHPLRREAPTRTHVELRLTACSRNWTLRRRWPRFKRESLVVRLPQGWSSRSVYEKPHLANLLTMIPIMAMQIMASDDLVFCSQSLLGRRQRPIHPNVRSTTRRRRRGEHLRRFLRELLLQPLVRPVGRERRVLRDFRSVHRVRSERTERPGDLAEATPHAGRCRRGDLCDRLLSSLMGWHPPPSVILSRERRGRASGPFRCAAGWHGRKHQRRACGRWTSRRPNDDGPWRGHGRSTTRGLFPGLPRHEDHGRDRAEARAVSAPTNRMEAAAAAWPRL